MSTTTLSKSIFLNASRETVWTFLTDKEKLGLWYHPAEETLKDGQDYVLFMEGDDGNMKKIVWGRVISMDPPSQLKTTFCIGPFDGAETTLTWTLHEAAGGTRLSLVHDGIAEASGSVAMVFLSNLDKGWDEHFGRLRNVV